MSNMPRKEVIDWLCRLRSNIPTFMPKIWHEKFINALDYAISSLEVDEVYQLEFEKPGFCEDCISREQAKAAIRDKFKDLPSRVEINTILNELTPVTPQEPRKGHWILTEDVAMKRVKDWERLKEEIKEYKSGIEPNSASEIWIISALSYIEGCMAEMENEE